jgi:hypothetical protein
MVQRAVGLAEHAALDGDARFLETQMHRYDAVTAPSTARALSAYLVPDRRVVTIVVPDATAPVAGRLGAGQ